MKRKKRSKGGLEKEGVEGRRGTWVVMVTNQGYIKRAPASTYHPQRRGGKGVRGLRTRRDDFLVRLFVAETKDYMLFFTDLGKVYWLKVSDLPESGRGKEMTKILRLEKMEGITEAKKISEFKEGFFLTMVTKEGMVKKTRLREFSHPRKGGIKAIDLGEYDELVKVLLTDGTDEIIVSTRDGKAIRFSETYVSPMGRNAQGVRAIKLEKGDGVVGAAVVEEEGTLLTMTENGYGKRSSFKRYPSQRRSGKGVRDIRITKKNGHVVSAKTVHEGEDIMCVTSKGKVIRAPVSDISEMGRNAQGVKIMDPGKDAKVISVVHVVGEREEREMGIGDREEHETFVEAVYKDEEAAKEKGGKKSEEKKREEAAEKETGEERSKAQKAKEEEEKAKAVEAKAKDEVEEAAEKEEAEEEDEIEILQKKIRELEGKIEDDSINVDKEVLTGMDKLVQLLQETDSIKTDQAAKELGFHKDLVEEWANTLEKAGIVKIKYSILGGDKITRGPNFEVFGK